ncbi:NnrS family protein [Trinickia violacea]|uniref:NnrS family protein n=1 Tax=Trinickia violacea TaxID=2571746 RepID=A0A4P8IVZ3_9BURK|nr:NnrS family protein [Trinickia violacea]QCP50029.1 NnrS family protein [Trinickia violacea]
MKIGEPRPSAMNSSLESNAMPVLRLGFRPFYLGGAAFGLVAVTLWLAALHGIPIAGRSPMMNGMIWHVHEMLFGFVAAILVGFLLTAVRAWTSLETPRGISLASLWLLWAAGRVLVWSGPEPVGAVIDSVFLPVVAWVLFRVLLAAGNRRNMFLPAALAVLGLMNVLFHWWTWHGRMDLALRIAYAATGLVIMFVAVIGGRVIPMFTKNAIPGFSVKHWKIIEALATPTVVLALFADALDAPSFVVIGCASAAAIVHATRIAGWRSWRVGARPLLWILHVAYLWIPIGFALLALSAWGGISHSLAIHALTVGAIGCAIVAMITRTALGHTGRPLVAGRVEVASYCLMIAGALLRVFGPWFDADASGAWLLAAGIAWCAALLVYLIKYVPFLTSARIDGKAG